MDIEIRDYQDNDLDSVNEVLEEAFQVKKDKVESAANFNGR